MTPMNVAYYYHYKTIEYDLWLKILRHKTLRQI